jgi:hypothetical protein
MGIGADNNIAAAVKAFYMSLSHGFLPFVVGNFTFRVSRFELAA